jgi:hypothetical protein
MSMETLMKPPEGCVSLLIDKNKKGSHMAAFNFLEKYLILSVRGHHHHDCELLQLQQHHHDKNHHK